MKKWLLVGILVFGFILRISFLGNFPSGFTPDEASFGYDAYSIIKTGKDQWGQTMPLVFESFGDYKSPLYTYLSIPSVAIFGLNKIAVRLPNAILGSIAVYVVYLLASKLFTKKVGLASAFVFAISPWHIMLSRGAFEANLTTFFLPLGIYLLLSKKYVLAGLALGLNLFSYHTAKFVTPAVILAFVLLYKSELIESWRSNKLSLISGIIVFFVFGAITAYTFLIGAGSRVSERIITQGATEAAFVDKTQAAKVVGDKLAHLMHNKYQITIKRFTENYFTYFSPQFLFTSGPREATYGMIPGRGVLLWFALPFLIAVRKFFYSNQNEENKKDYKKAMILLGLWIFISPIPASLASGVGFAANRVAAMMPAIDILIGLGAYVVFEMIKARKIILIGATAIVLVLFGLFIEDYIVEFPLKSSQAMLYGNLEVVSYLKDTFPSDQTIIVDKSLSEPQIYFAFENKIDPEIYQDTSKTWDYKSKGVSWVDQMGEYRLGNVIFKDISKADINPGAVLVGRPDDFVFDINPQKIIYYPSGGVAAQVVKL